MATKLAPKLPHVLAVWFAGVCDTLFQSIQMWTHKYEQGELYATGPYMTVELKDIVGVPVWESLY
jgi:Cu2+-containing amine oxidase